MAKGRLWNWHAMFAPNATCKIRHVECSLCAASPVVEPRVPRQPGPDLQIVRLLGPLTWLDRFWQTGPSTNSFPEFGKQATGLCLTQRVTPTALVLA